MFILNQIFFLFQQLYSDVIESQIYRVKVRSKMNNAE